MKLSVKYAGLFASGAFMVVALPVFFKSLQPVKVFYLGVPAALIAGFLGYQVGRILENPKKSKAERRAERRPPEGEPRRADPSQAVLETPESGS